VQQKKDKKKALQKQGFIKISNIFFTT